MTEEPVQLTRSQLKRRRQAANRQARWDAEKKAGIAAARAVCPTPSKTSYGSIERATEGAQAMADKSDMAWMSYSCVCGRFHIRPVR